MLNAQTNMQQLRLLTCLQGLRLHMCSPWTLSSDTVSTPELLTYLGLMSGRDDATVHVETDALASMSRLRHLCLAYCNIVCGTAGAAALFSVLQQMHQLTHLALCGSLQHSEGGAPAAAYAALTASSDLQHLDLSGCNLPFGVWQHVLPANWQLSSLRGLDLSYLTTSNVGGLQLGDISRLVNCCPGLQSLTTYGGLTAELLAPLCSLTGLQRLAVRLADDAVEAGVDVFAQMTGLRRLSLVVDHADRFACEEVLFRLTHLRQLTSLQWPGGGALLPEVRLGTPFG